LDESEHVIHKEEHIFAALVAEVFGLREPGERDAGARARHLVHLPEDERRLLEDARLLHLMIEIIPFAHTLTDARED
jgi:hypothetical protein